MDFYNSTSKTSIERSHSPNTVVPHLLSVWNLPEVRAANWSLKTLVFKPLLLHFQIS